MKQIFNIIIIVYLLTIEITSAIIAAPLHCIWLRWKSSLKLRVMIGDIYLGILWIDWLIKLIILDLLQISWWLSWSLIHASENLEIMRVNSRRLGSSFLLLSGCFCSTNMDDCGVMLIMTLILVLIRMTAILTMPTPDLFLCLWLLFLCKASKAKAAALFRHELFCFLLWWDNG